MERGGTTDYYEADSLGSITSLTVGSGTGTQSYTYDSFGNTTNSSGSLTNFFRYASRRTETNFYYYRARYYDSITGRFVSEDPTRFKTGIDFYAYALNNPIVFRDPTGLDCGCTYSISTGHFHCYGMSITGNPINFESWGYSGLPQYQNDVASTSLWGGPIPIGTYTISPGYLGSLGNPQFNLTPEPGTIPPGRDPNSFLIHAENPKHPGGSSEGCIVLPLKGRKQLGQCGGGTLNVSP
jgi:RHS repeat-associated protein